MVALLIRAEAVNRGHGKAALDREDAADSAIDRLDLRIDQSVGDRVPFATRLVEQADDAELAELPDQVARNRFRSPPLLDLRRQLLLGEYAGAIPQLALVPG